MFMLPYKNLFTTSVFLFLFLTASIVTAATQNKRAKVIFISVASETEQFWNGIHSHARAAANDLGIDLEILLSNRNHITAVNMAKQLAQSQNKPDYVIVVGEKFIASSSIPTLTKSGIKVFMFGSLNKEEKELIGEPREKYPDYIGKIAIDDYMAGYLTTELMVQEAIRKHLHDKNKHINFLAFEGVKETSFNSERVRGRDDALKKYPQARILQSVSTNWSYENAKDILPSFLMRYSENNIAGIWCANSALASGSSDVLRSLGKTPGVDMLTVGTDWNISSIESVDRGDILGIAGGHVATVAWILTLIHDYHNGIDFDSSVYLSKVTVIDKQSSKNYLKYFKEDGYKRIDFSRYSKIENPTLKKYDFSFETILNDLYR